MRKWILWLLTALLIVGCESAQVTVITTPSGAEVVYNGHSLGVTPLQFAVQQPGFIVIKKDGYREETSKVELGATRALNYNITLKRLPPPTYVQTQEATWATVEVRDGMTYEQAWTTVIDLLVKKFDVEILSKGDGYARTGWLHSWTGEVRSDYRVRCTIKFSPDHTKVEVKSEAQYLVDSDWQPGMDTALLQTLKTDFMGSIGRTTR